MMSGDSRDTKATTANPYEVSLNMISKNMKNGSLLIDVRTIAEYEKDHAIGAINIPLADIQKGVLPQTAKNKIIYVYCHSGKRALQAKTILEQTGFEHVISITSLYNWVSMGGENIGTNPVCSAAKQTDC